MKHSNSGALITLWANRLIGVTVIALLFLLPRLLDWYSSLRQLLPNERTALTIAFYCCAVVTLFALFTIEKLLGSILRELVFIRENVRRISRIQWCCALVSLICLPAAFIYYPLIFMVIIMAFLCLVVSVVRQVMDAAVTIREENDLTI